jgi:hypothetical protein
MMLSCDAALLVAFGGPASPDEIRPFISRVLRGYPVPAERIEEVARHYEAIGGRSPLNEITFRQAHALENALYIAVEVQDDSIVKEYPGWPNRQDGCEVVVDAYHQEDEGLENVEFVQYTLRGGSPGVYGAGTVEDVAVTAQWEEGGYRFEWRVDIGKVSAGRVRIRPGMVLGFNVTLWDKDRDDSASWICWAKGNWYYAGDLVLVESKTEVLKGRLQWEGTDQGVARGKVQIRSRAVPEGWLQVETDRRERS